MKYYVETSLDEFELWAGGADTKDIIKAYDRKHKTNFWQELCDLADDLFYEPEYEEVAINDWLWFDVREDPESFGLPDDILN